MTGRYRPTGTAGQRHPLLPAGGVVLAASAAGVVCLEQGNELTHSLGIAVLAVTAAAAGAAVVAELLHLRASRRTGAEGMEGGGVPDAVVVLGFRSLRGGLPHPLQRWRVRIAVRSMDPDGSTLLVFTGGGRGDGPTEAEVMAAYARDAFGVPADRILVETEARNTEQNLRFTVPLLATADRIAIASDPMHAARARRLLRRLHPELASRLVPADDHRWFEHPVLKAATAAHELRLAARDARRPGPEPYGSAAKEDRSR